MHHQKKLYHIFRTKTPNRRQSKMLIHVLSTNVDQNSLEIEFLIAICHQTGDKWQSKTLYLAIFHPRFGLLLRAFLIAAYPVCIIIAHSQ